ISTRASLLPLPAGVPARRAPDVRLLAPRRRRAARARGEACLIRARVRALLGAPLRHLPRDGPRLLEGAEAACGARAHSGRGLGARGPERPPRGGSQGPRRGPEGGGEDRARGPRPREAGRRRAAAAEGLAEERAERARA